MLNALARITPPSAVLAFGSTMSGVLTDVRSLAGDDASATLVVANPTQRPRTGARSRDDGVSIIEAVIGPDERDVTYYDASYGPASGLTPPDAMREVWPKLTATSREVRTQTMDAVAAEAGCMDGTWVFSNLPGTATTWAGAVGLLESAALVGLGPVAGLPSDVAENDEPLEAAGLIEVWRGRREGDPGFARLFARGLRDARARSALAARSAKEAARKADSEAEQQARLLKAAQDEAREQRDAASAARRKASEDVEAVREAARATIERANEAKRAAKAQEQAAMAREAAMGDRAAAVEAREAATKARLDLALTDLADLRAQHEALTDRADAQEGALRRMLARLRADGANEAASDG